VLKGVVFDFDGVIVDSHAVHQRAWRKFLESVGESVSDEQLQFVLDGRKRDDILRHFLGNLDSDKLNEYGRQKELIFRSEAANVQVIEGLLEFLEELEDAQLLLGIASSGSRSRVEFLLGRLALRQRFRVVVTGDEVESGKPSPALFLRAAHDLHIDPCELLALEDAFSGVKAAKAAGMKCVGIAQADRASILLDAGADRVVPNFGYLSYAELREVFCQ
jgi:HAD superfamily hydrolase (TIGR01509 family)